MAFGGLQAATFRRSRQPQAVTCQLRKYSESSRAKYIPNKAKSIIFLMGFGHFGLWVMGYYGGMGLGPEFLIYQLGFQIFLWGFAVYGLRGLWVKRDSSVLTTSRA